jgi:glucan phosphoethanolaminetransferase (alkaline phosphatase superfamily)
VENYPNFVGLLLAVLSVILLFLIKGSDHWRISVLIVGVLLIILAALSFGVFTDMGGLFDLLSEVKKIDEPTHRIAKTAASIWVVILPAIQGAVGANLISSWFLSKKSS